MIKAFGLVPKFIDDFHDVQQNHENIIRSKQISNIWHNYHFIIGQVIGYACYGYALFRLASGAISYGTMTMFVEWRIT
ncbi:MAG: hypothetical protein ACLR43_13910 [Faecalibacillus faecis]